MPRRSKAPDTAPSAIELEAWLKAKSWGASDAARFLNMNVRTVQRWRDGTRTIPNWLRTIFKMEGKK